MNRRFPKIAERVSLIYWIVGVTWIFVSDHLSGILAESIPQFQRLETFKGLVFVSLTAVLIWFLIRNQLNRLRQSEKALRDSEMLLRTVIRSLPDLVWLKDPQGFYLACNQRFERFFGAEEKDIIGRTDYDFVDKEMAEFFIKQDQIAEKKGNANIYEETVTFVDDGHKEILETTKTPIYKTEGALLGVLGIAHDITRRKQMEKSLKESIMRQNEAVKAANVGLWDWDLNTNKVIYSEEWKRQIGYTAQEISDDLKEWEDRVHHDDLGPTLKKINATIKNAKPKNRHSVEFRFRHKNGSYRWILAQASVITNEKGRPVRLLGSHIDITDYKQALRELERKSIAIENSINGFDIVDSEGKFIYVNKAYIRMWGYENAREIIGTSPVDHCADPTVPETIIQTLRRDGKCKIEFKAKRKDESTFDVLMNTILMHDDVGDELFSGTSIDISERKKADREKRDLQEKLNQAQKMESLGTLAGGIAHDFNNILFPIIGMSEMLMEDLSPGSVEYDNAEEILKAGRRGADLVKQILAFSRQTEMKMIPVGIQHVLREVLKLCRSSIPADIDIKTIIQRDCGLVLADPTQIHQIAMNLITNAYHAVEENAGGLISVELTEIESADDFVDSNLAPGRYALFSVSDNGSGIDPKIMNQIFEPYFTTKARGKGTGLGLSVVHGIVRAHKGDIQIVSERRKGTSVKIFIPLLKDKSADAFNRAEQEALPTGTEHILLVDDEASVLRLEKQVLERLGYKITARSSSIEALEAFKANPEKYDLVVSDMSMPKMTGDMLAEKINALNPDLPVIICTGFSERIDHEGALKIGVKGLLMKPVIKSDMAKMVRKVLDESRE